MIVVAAHDNIEVLNNLLTSMKNNNVMIPICIVNTGSILPDFVSYLESIHDIFPELNVLVLHGPSQYEAGAWVHAYKNTNADEYLFIHDSMICNCNDPLQVFREKASIEELDVVAFRCFHGLWGMHDGLHNMTEKAFGHRDVNKYHQLGVFGSIFYCKRHVLDKLFQNNLLRDELLPFDKNTSMSWERFWPILFQETGINYHGLGDFFHQYKEPQLNPITKVFLNRQ